MIGNINFTGLKNIGGMYNIEINASTSNGIGYLKPVERKYLLVKLTNDESGNDRDKFELAKALGSPDLDFFYFLHDKRYLNIFTEKAYHQNVTPRLFLNLEELPIKKNTMPMFDFLAKLTKKIANKNNDEFIYEDKFPMCDAGDLFIMGDTRISEITSGPTEYINSTLHVYNPVISRQMAKMINDDIQMQMENYFL